MVFFTCCCASCPIAISSFTEISDNPCVAVAQNTSATTIAVLRIRGAGSAPPEFPPADGDGAGRWPRSPRLRKEG